MFRILTVRQPWASLIITPGNTFKDIENRTWPTNYRGPVGIHASAKVERDAFRTKRGARRNGEPYGDFDLQALVDAERLTSVVLGIVSITGCHREGSPECVFAECRSNLWAHWTADPFRPVYHWELDHVRQFVTPIKAKGALKLWEPDPSLKYLIDQAEYTDA